jgi:hypothetical protein
VGVAFAFALCMRWRWHVDVEFPLKSTFLNAKWTHNQAA